MSLILAAREAPHCGDSGDADRNDDSVKTNDFQRRHGSLVHDHLVVRDPPAPGADDGV